MESITGYMLLIMGISIGGLLNQNKATLKNFIYSTLA